VFRAVVSVDAIPIVLVEDTTERVVAGFKAVDALITPIELVEDMSEREVVGFKAVVENAD
jgi:hypothetical protein